MSIYKEFDIFIEANFSEKEEIKKIKVCYDLAKYCHKDQVDKSGKNYIEHCIQVALNTQSRDWNIICVALLHDVIEDYYMVEFPDSYIDVSAEVFEAVGIPVEVYDEVVCLSKLKFQTYDTYINRIKSSEIATEVKLADLKHNMDITRLNNLTDKDIERLKKYHAAFKYLKG